MQKKPDYAKKARVIQSGLPNIEKKISKAFYADWKLHTDGEIIKTHYNIETADYLQSFYLQNDPENYAEAHKINVASYKRKQRLRKRLSQFLEDGRCCFLTLTFNDDILDHTSEQTRRDYIRKFLKSFGVPYVANKDFGKDFGREHYHAVIQKSRIDLKKYNYGFIFAETIRSASDRNKLSSYLDKLTNHAIKETTRRSVILYSR